MENDPAKSDNEFLEDKQRLENMRETGGIPHREMMDWLDDLAQGKEN